MRIQAVADFLVGLFVPIFLGYLPYLIGGFLPNNSIYFLIPLSFLLAKFSNLEGTFGDWTLVSALLLFFHFRKTRKYISIGALIAGILALILIGYVVYWGISRNL